jgi:hypothetical protein
MPVGAASAYHAWPAATIGANLAHGIGHGPIGAIVSAWPALAVVGSYELLMLLIRNQHEAAGREPDIGTVNQPGRPLAQTTPAVAPTLEQTIRDWHQAGHSQRAIARELNIDRRKIKNVIEAPR